MDNYENIIRDNLEQLYKNLPENLDKFLPGQRQQNIFRFRAFGGLCQIKPDGVTIDDEPQTGAVGIIITLYALRAGDAPCLPTPFKAFRELPNSLPYVGAFATHTESILVPQIHAIEKSLDIIFEALNGEPGHDLEGGDFSIIVRPLPKIMLRYIFYLADEDFPASATCLFSSNVLTFLPIDALADTGEYCSKKIIELVA